VTFTGSSSPARTSPSASFAHPSEAAFARILSYYRIEWHYEPRTFPIRWDPDGRIVESFTPDFFLPELGLYVELTTLKQSLVTRKNRKLRLLRRLYPEIAVKLFYRGDLGLLLGKYAVMGKVPVHARTRPRVATAMKETDRTALPE
jgi:hypoxanthine phosphoribosyltransferase